MALAGVAACVFTAPALALPPPPYAAVEIGRTSIGLDPTGIEEAGLQPSVSDRRDTGYAITLGWRFSPHLAAEGTFAELGEGRYAVAVEDGGPVSNVTVGVRSSGVLLSLAGTWPLHDRLSLEGRAGAYFGKTETRVRGVMTSPLVGNQTFSSLLGSDSKVGLAAGIGAVTALNETWGLRVGYDYLDKAFGKDARRISLGVRFNWP
jgi:opacity protein-like surface antigen